MSFYKNYSFLHKLNNIVSFTCCAKRSLLVLITLGLQLRAVKTFYWTTDDSIIFDLYPESIKVKRGSGSSFYYNDNGRRIPRLSAKEDEAAPSEISPPPDCYTPSDKKGECILFHKCYPILFTVDGTLRNPGLAEILFQTSGPCNTSLVFNLPALNGDNFNKNGKELYKQMICCAGYSKPTNLPNQHPPPGVASSRLPITSFNNEKRSSQKIDSSHHLKPSESTSNTQNENEEHNKDDSNEYDKEDGRQDELKNHQEHHHNDEGFKPITSPNVEENLDNHQKQEEPNLKAWTCPGRNLFMPLGGNWPWQVALLQDGRHFCSGSLIDHIHILTSAHCIYNLSAKDVSKIRIILGDRVMYTMADGPHQWRKVVRITRHLNYNHNTLHNDVAILTMDSEVQFTPNIKPINLPPNADYSHVKKALISGWSGVDIGKAWYDPRPPRDAVVELMDTHECQEIYNPVAPKSVVDTMHLCTKSTNQTCFADVGAPLMIKTNHCWYIIGITSWNLNCNFPEVYLNVGLFLPWLNKNIRNHQWKAAYEHNRPR